MMIIGCDFHPSWQQVSWLDTETGETGEQKLVQASGDAERFYRQVPAPALIGMEATGNSHWRVDLRAELGHELWVGDAAQIRASYVRQQKTDKRDAAHILKLLVEGRFPKIWMPSSGVRDLRQLLLHRYKLVILRARVKNELQHLCLNQGVQRKHKLWSKAGQKLLRELPLQPWAGRRRDDLLALMAMFEQQIEPLDQAVKAEAQRDKMAQFLQTQPGVGPITALAYVLTLGDVSRFPRGKQVASYLGLIPREHSSGGRQKLGAITKQRQSHVAHVAGGSGPGGGALRSPVSPGVSASLSSEAEGGGLGGSGAQVGGPTVLDAAHPPAISRSRSHREQPAGGPGRRKLDRKC
jgi:transposase